jgi:hypothetical protein
LTRASVGFDPGFDVTLEGLELGGVGRLLHHRLQDVPEVGHQNSVIAQFAKARHQIERPFLPRFVHGPIDVMLESILPQVFLDGKGFWRNACLFVGIPDTRGRRRCFCLNVFLN